MKLRSEETCTNHLTLGQSNAATSTSAIALCTRHLSDGSLVRASRAALLAQRLMRLETEQAERARKQDAKHAIERCRAEAALAQANRAVALLDEPPKPRHQPLSDGELHAMLARLPTPDAPGGQDPPIDALPVQFSARDSC